jgi:hypothetical protein
MGNLHQTGCVRPLRLLDYNREYERSGSVTAVEGRSFGDVWITQGDAIVRKGKPSRALGLMTPVPRLAVPDDTSSHADRV